MHAKGNSGNLTTYAGYTAQKMVSAWCHALDIMYSIYDCPLILSISFQPEAKPYVTPVIQYAKSIFPKDRILFQFNSLQEKTDRTYISPILDLARQGYWIGAEKVQPKHKGNIPELDYIVNYPGDENGYLV
jgi:hypothetical protein